MNVNKDTELFLIKKLKSVIKNIENIKYLIVDGYNSFILVKVKKYKNKNKNKNQNLCEICEFTNSNFCPAVSILRGSYLPTFYFCKLFNFISKEKVYFKAVNFLDKNQEVFNVITDYCIKENRKIEYNKKFDKKLKFVKKFYSLNNKFYELLHISKYNAVSYLLGFTDKIDDFRLNFLYKTAIEFRKKYKIDNIYFKYIYNDKYNSIDKLLLSNLCYDRFMLDIKEKIKEACEETVKRNKIIDSHKVEVKSRKNNFKEVDMNYENNMLT